MITENQQRLLDNSPDVIDIRATTLILGVESTDDFPEGLIAVEGGYSKEQIIAVLNA